MKEGDVQSTLLFSAYLAATYVFDHIVFPLVKALEVTIRGRFHESFNYFNTVSFAFCSNAETSYSLHRHICEILQAACQRDSVILSDFLQSLKHGFSVSILISYISLLEVLLSNL